MKKILISISLAIALFFSGCAVKQDDNVIVKGMKHTVNTPIYVGEVLDKGAKLAIILPLALVVKGVRTLKSEDNNETKED